MRHQTDPVHSSPKRRPAPAEVRILDYISDLMDSRFRIPGTSIRFGLDSLIGIIPGLGDIVSYAMGSALVIGMVRKGATVNMVLRMLWNLGLDTFLGTFPIVGDIFDVWFKANRRNYKIFSEYVRENKEPRPIWPVLLLVLVGVFGLLALLLYLLFFWLPGLYWRS